LSNDYADPNARIVTEMSARGLTAGIQGEELSDEQREALQDELDEAFGDLRDGIGIIDD